jgi:hypothetical protein
MKKLSREGTLIVWSLAAAVLLIVATAILTPAAVERDERPTSYNANKNGVKAAFLALGRLGYQTERWQRPSAELAGIDASSATLIVAAPRRDLIANEAVGILDFARRGGWVLATGSSAAVALLPDGHAIETRSGACDTKPENLGPIAHIPGLHFEQSIFWKQAPVDVEFAQSCGDRAAVLIFPVGHGAVLYWSQSHPMSNEGLRDNANLQLLLASLPANRRRVLFDEYVHDFSDTLWNHASQTPLIALRWQLALLMLALIFSFSRRHGPLRDLETTPRTSPLEFSHSMGSVYHRAGAGEAAVDQAQRGLFDFIEHRCCISRSILEQPPAAICQALANRLNYTNPALEALLVPPDGRLEPARALARVRALHDVIQEISLIVNKPNPATEKPHRVCT